MKPIPLIVFLVLLAASSVTALVTLFKNSARFSSKNELVGKKLVTGFSSSDVLKVRLAKAENEVVLTRKDDKWVVPSRTDFPIDSAKEIERLVASLLALQVGLEIPADAKHFALMGLLSPDEKEQIEKHKESEKAKGEEDPADPSGLLVTFFGAGDSVHSSIIFGEDFGGDPGQPLRGIVVRDLAGNKGVWKVVGTINRRTGELGGTDVRRGPLAEAKSWLAYKFLEVEKIKSIALSAPNDKEFKGWAVTRETEEGDFAAGDVAEDEEMDTGSASAFKTLFAKLRFEDILDPAEAEKKKDPAGARQAVFTTFEGFTYTFDLVPIKAEEKSEDEDGPPPPPSNYVGTVKIEGKFAETRVKGENETEEQAKAQDQAFALTLENLKAKLVREKAYEAHTYEFAQYTVNSLLKSRSEIVKKKAPPPPEGKDDKKGAGKLPGNRPSAVTPPVRIPPVPPKKNK